MVSLQVLGALVTHVGYGVTSKVQSALETDSAGLQICTRFDSSFFSYNWCLVFFYIHVHFLK